MSGFLHLCVSNSPTTLVPDTEIENEDKQRLKSENTNTATPMVIPFHPEDPLHPQALDAHHTTTVSSNTATPTSTTQASSFPVPASSNLPGITSSDPLSNEILIENTNPRISSESPQTPIQLTGAPSATTMAPNLTREKDKDTISTASSIEDTVKLNELSHRSGPLLLSSKDKFDLQNYLKEFEGRLGFIRFLLTNSYNTLDLRHVKLLWDLLVINGLADQEREVFFNFFSSICLSISASFSCY